MKILIVDDEKIIRETISNHIPWQDLGIDDVQTASNGLEAYDIILDESPDIVMTDIKMPGLSGLELLNKVHKLNDDMEFIILSGYGEFDFAREAMHYGVHHYLLKPSNEEQIIESVKEALDALSQKRTYKELSREAISAQQTITLSMLNIVNECLAAEVIDPPNYEDIFRPYRKFMDFTGTAYELCYLYFVDFTSLTRAVSYIESYRTQFAPNVSVTYLYVNQTLVFYFASYRLDYRSFDEYMERFYLASQSTQPQFRHEHLHSLEDVIYEVIGRIRRYDTIYCVQGDNITTICNYPSIMRNVESLTLSMYGDDASAAQSAFDELMQTISSVSDVAFLKQLASSIIMLSASKCITFSSYEAASFLVDLGNVKEAKLVLEDLEDELQSVFDNYHAGKSGSPAISDAIDGYVRANLSASDLSLKWIAENYLYMNVDYVSKKFLKETGVKFSAYLTNLRIEKAKELLVSSDTDKIQNIAEMVGCGNNPQYFSQLFKKATGMTPTAYIKKTKEGAE